MSDYYDFNNRLYNKVPLLAETQKIATILFRTVEVVVSGVVVLIRIDVIREHVFVRESISFLIRTQTEVA